MKKINFCSKKESNRLFKLSTLSLLIVFSASFLVSSCSKDDNDDDNGNIPPRTNVNGKPSKYAYTFNGELHQTYFFYNGAKLSKIKIGDIEEFYIYNGGELTKIETRNTNKNIADGNGCSKFTRKDNIIEVETVGEPSSSVYKEKIELNSSNLPTKIYNNTKIKGINEKTEIAPDTFFSYTLYTYDSSNRLTQMEVFTYPNEELYVTVTLEYDSTKGSVSNNGLPTWYNVYSSDHSYSSLNYINNVIKRTIVYHLNNEKNKVMNNTYEYNKDNYPISSLQQIDGQDDSRSYTIEY